VATGGMEPYGELLSIDEVYGSKVVNGIELGYRVDLKLTI